MFEDIWKELRIEAIVAIILSVSTALLGILWSSKIRQAVQQLFRRTTGFGLTGLFDDFISAPNARLENLCRSTRRLRILSWRGHGGTQFLFTYRELLANAHIDVLLLNPRTKEGKRFLRERENEIRRSQYARSPDPASVEPFETSLKHSIERLKALRTHIPNLRIFLYTARPVWCVYIFDGRAFVGGFTTHDLGRFGQFYCAKQNTTLYRTAERHIDYLIECQSTNVT